MIAASRLKNVSDKKFFEAFDTLGNIQKSKHVRGPLSEHDILDLQDKFLNNGFHYINVSDLQFGRSLVFQFLKSLKHCHENAILTVSMSLLDAPITDVYYELIQGGYLDKSQHKDLDEFFIDQFYYDFLVIEACHELVDSYWFSEFFNRLINFKIDQNIPVLVVSYSK